MPFPLKTNRFGMRDVLVSPIFCVAQECRNEIIKDGMRDVSTS